jgi:hypothetical protein
MSGARIGPTRWNAAERHWRRRDSLKMRPRNMPWPSGTPQPGAHCTYAGARRSTNSATAHGPCRRIALRENSHYPTQTSRPWLAISRPEFRSSHCSGANRSARKPTVVNVSWGWSNTVIGQWQLNDHEVNVPSRDAGARLPCGEKISDTGAAPS